MIEQIKTRRSIRKFLDKPVEDDKIMQLLESARLAPSGSNTQPWHFIIVRSESTRKKLAAAAQKQKWMLYAPVFIACVADIRSRIKDNIEIELDENSPHQELKQIIRDTAIAIEHIVLEAESIGLSTCWVAWYTQDEIRPILKVPADKYVVSIIVLGYADELPKARPRKKLEEFVHNETW